jgi:CSLREA domain-containing protein
MIGRAKRRLNRRYVLVGVLTLAMVATLASLGGVGYGFPLRAQYHVYPYIYGTFVVNTTSDAVDASTADGLCETAAGDCSLRAAIQQANATVGTDYIRFDIPGPGPHTISPNSALPTVMRPAIIDGATEPDYSGFPVIELDGSGAPSGGPFVNGLTITADSSFVRGLVINRFAGNGIAIVNADDNALEGNYIGTNVAGTADRGNSADGVVLIGSSNNRVGGPGGAKNVISGNDSDGISIIAGSNTNVIEGNYIGTTVDGDAALGNSDNGVFGGGSQSAVTDNVIRDNVISANSRAGVRLNNAGTTDNKIENNSIGTDVSRTIDLGNHQHGVSLEDGTSKTQVTGNVVSGNDRDGVLLSSAGPTNTVVNNRIGTDGGGSANVGNSGAGVRVAGASGVVNSGNTIAFNGDDGVVVVAGNVGIFGNSIFTNGGLGIDLAPDGVTANDPGDGDSGPNDLQNFPVLTSAINAGGVTTVQGTLNSRPNGVFRVDLYSNAACDPSGHGEGEKNEGIVNVVTDPAGDGNFTATLATSVGRFITATATPLGPAGGTSEFSACREVTTPAGAVADIEKTVDSLGLHPGTANSLKSKLRAAGDALTRGQTKTACNNLNAFENEVRAQSGKKIPEKAASGLAASADAVENVIGC